MALWILACKMNEDMDILFAYYAKDRADAEEQARKIVREQGYERRELKAYPFGFVMCRERLAGVIEQAGSI